MFGCVARKITKTKKPTRASVTAPMAPSRAAPNLVRSCTTPFTADTTKLCDGRNRIPVGKACRVLG